MMFNEVKMLLRTSLFLVASLSLVTSMKVHIKEATVKSKGVRVMHIVKEEYKEVLSHKNFPDTTGSSCSCVNYTCGCCVQVVIEKISLNETGCVNVSYLPDQYGFQFLFTLNGQAIINDTISAKNPPPICAPIPYAQQLASVCIRFYNLDYQAKQFSGCVDFEVDVEGAVVKKYDIGCFHIPPSEKHLLNGRDATSTSA